MLKLLGSTLFCANLAFAQNVRPQFEVASVKPAPPGETGGRIQYLPGGIYKVSNVALRFIIQNTYEIRDFQIVSDPQMTKLIADGYDARYYIEAKAAASSATEAQMRELAKQQLSERFAQQVHSEPRELPVYALIPAKGGVKLQGFARVAPSIDGIVGMVTGWTQGNNVTVASLVNLLTGIVDRPVIDKTGFTEAFNYRLTYLANPAADPETLSPDGCPRAMADFIDRRGLNVGPMSCPDRFTAVQEQLGLKLDAQKAPLEVLVVDHAEKPSAN